MQLNIASISLHLFCYYNKLLDISSSITDAYPLWHKYTFLTPLHCACKEGLSDVAVKLIENGAAIDAVDKVGIEWRW